MVGKWDLGHYASSLWPTKRGFDSSLHLSCYGFTDYTRHINLAGWSDLHDGMENMDDDRLNSIGAGSDALLVWIIRFSVLAENHALLSIRFFGQ